MNPNPCTSLPNARRVATARAALSAAVAARADLPAVCDEAVIDLLADLRHRLSRSRKTGQPAAREHEPRAAMHANASSAQRVESFNREFVRRWPRYPFPYSQVLLGLDTPCAHRPLEGAYNARTIQAVARNQWHTLTR